MDNMDNRDDANSGSVDSMNENKNDSMKMPNKHSRAKLLKTI